MSATIDQNLVPNAVAEFHTAKDHGKSDAEAWKAAVARIRYDVLRLAIAVLSIETVRQDEHDGHVCRQCIKKLDELKGDYGSEPDKPL